MLPERGEPAGAAPERVPTRPGGALLALVVGAALAGVPAALAGGCASAATGHRPAAGPTTLSQPPSGHGGAAVEAGTAQGHASRAARTRRASLRGRPNIVFVLTDDLSMNLLRFMPHVLALQRRGITFANYFVSDSLCCPSRSSIFTGNFPHDTRVFSNVGSQGGFHVFYRRGEQRRTFAFALQRRGYLTAMMGKYLNGYLQRRGGVPGLPATYVPPGWSEWDVAGDGYPEFDYTLNADGGLYDYGHAAPDYLTDVLALAGERFIARAAAAARPFMLEIATFSPHSPYVPAPRDSGAFPGLRLERTPNFNRLPHHAPEWLAAHEPLSDAQIAQNERVYRLRAQDVLSVDRMIAGLERALRAAGVARNTYLVFSSDNGLHTGEYRLMPGKMTAFDVDIHVPLVIAGPGVPRARRSSAMAENIDLAETFDQIGGVRSSGDGHSLLALAHGGSASGWRDAVLVEHHGPDLRGVDPDFQQTASGSPRTYEAMRTRRLLYVEYDDGERELYDLLRDPFELNNLAGSLSSPQRRQLHAELVAIERCHRANSCWAAMHVAPLRGRLPHPARRTGGVRSPA